MAFALAIAVGALLTAVAVALAGLVLNVLLHALGRSLTTAPVTDSLNVKRLKPGKAFTGSAWGQRAAA